MGGPELGGQVGWGGCTCPVGPPTVFQWDPKASTEYVSSVAGAVDGKQLTENVPKIFYLCAR